MTILRPLLYWESPLGERNVYPLSTKDRPESSRLLHAPLCLLQSKRPNLNQNLHLAHQPNSLVGSEWSLFLRNWQPSVHINWYTLKLWMEAKVNAIDACFNENMHYFRATEFDCMPCPATKLRSPFVVPFKNARRASQIVPEPLPV